MAQAASLLLVFWAWAFAASAAPPRLGVEAVPERPLQGGVVWLTVRTDRPLTALTLVDGERSTALASRDGGRVFHGLLGIDFESPAGVRTLRFETSAAGERESVPWRLQVLPGRFITQKLRVDPKYVEVPEAERDRVKADQARVAQVWRSPDPGWRWAFPFVSPVAAPSQGNFGARRVYNGQTMSRHAGLDLSAPEGTPVVAAAAGRVALAGDLYFSGGTVILDHGGGLFTTYFHLSRVDAKEGSAVAAGAPVGLVGATGRVTGPHLHWGARLGGARVDPSALTALPTPPPTP